MPSRAGRIPASVIREALRSYDGSCFECTAIRRAGAEAKACHRGTEGYILKSPHHLHTLCTRITQDQLREMSAQAPRAGLRGSRSSPAVNTSPGSHATSVLGATSGAIHRGSAATFRFDGIVGCGWVAFRARAAASIVAIAVTMVVAIVIRAPVVLETVTPVIAILETARPTHALTATRRKQPIRFCCSTLTSGPPGTMLALSNVFSALPPDCCHHYRAATCGG